MEPDLLPPKQRRSLKEKAKEAMERPESVSIGNRQENARTEVPADMSMGQYPVPLLRSRPASSPRTAAITTTKTSDLTGAASSRPPPWRRVLPPRAHVARRPTN